VKYRGDIFKTNLWHKTFPALKENRCSLLPLSQSKNLIPIHSNLVEIAVQK